MTKEDKVRDCKESTGNIPYLPHTTCDRESMLDEIGIETFERLVEHIPQDIRVQSIDIDQGISELELTRHIEELASSNKPASHQACFLGGGSYQRYVPAVVPQIVSRSEFATAYTPYQPEVSQGSLQAIYEFQSAICMITGADVANASMYDGPTACAEAGLMACRITGREKLITLSSVNPEHRMVTGAYTRACGLGWSTVDCPQGVLSIDDLSLDADTAGLIIQYPNFFGCFEQVEELARRTKENGTCLIVVTEPISLGLLEPPGKLGADIIVGDAQPCGNFMSFGGPSAGFMACKKEYMRQLPGRLAGITMDKNGERAFTLTLQTREQHIRRAKATSNICTNQALNALAMLVYLTMIGKTGFKRLSEISFQRAHYLAEQLCHVDGAELAFDHPFLNEFVLRIDVSVEGLIDDMKRSGILCGINLGRMYPDLSDCLLVAVTEMNSRKELDHFARSLSESLSRLRDGCQDESDRVAVSASKS